MNGHHTKSMTKSTLVLYVLLVASGVAAFDFWASCPESGGLHASLDSCNITKGPGTVPVQSPDYIWRSPVNASRQRHSGAEFMLRSEVHTGSRLYLPPIFPAKHLGNSRQFLHDGVKMNVTAVAQTLPSWKYQAEYVTSFCSPEYITCVSTRAEAVAHARYLLTNYTRTHYVSPVEDKVLVMKNVVPVIYNEPAVACHDVYFTFQMLACHHLRNFTLFSVETTAGSQQYVACHGDTSIWPPEHPAYKHLHVPYGTPGICHAENEKVVFFA